MSNEPSNQRRMPPYSLEAERAVIGGVLLNNDRFNSVVDIVKTSDFYKESHQIIFEAISDICDTGDVVDLVTLKNHLEKAGLLQKAGGVENISALLEGSSTAANLEYYARIIKEKSILRNLIRIGERIAEKGYKARDDADELVDNAEAAIFELSQSQETRGPSHIKDIIHKTFDRLAALSESTGIVTGVPTGFEELDKLTTGLHSGELVIIAGRPAMGKTTFGINIVHHIAVSEKAPCLLFSLEMTKEQLVQRMLCAEAEVDAQELRRGNVEGEDWSRLARSAASLSLAPVFIDDTPAISTREMKSRARRIKAKWGLELIVIDYLQLMSNRKRYESRQLEISDISRSLKFMAKELDCPVVALSQLSRAVESRKDNRPQLSDLRESGAIEQDADLVMMLYRPEYYGITEIERAGRKENSKGIAEIIVAKQRNGPPGSLYLAFRDNLLQFKDIYRPEGSEEQVIYPEEYQSSV